MRTILPIVGILLQTAAGLSPTGCSDSYGSTCVSAVRSLLLDQSAFWFGTYYTSVCPQRQDGRLECVNRHSDRTDSLLSRMTGQYALDPAYMSFVINVTYTIQLPRTYDGCGVKVTAPLVTPLTFTIDPLNETLYHPFDVRAQPRVTWPSETTAKYTVVFYDASFFRMNALYVNVHGGSVVDGETVLNYTGPVNPLSRTSPYVWAVFEQQGALQADDVTTYINSAMNASRSVYLEDIITRFHLLGPYGVNIIRLTTDEYASVLGRAEGTINNCPIYYARWLDKHIQERGGLSYLPAPLSLSVSVDLTFTTPDMAYTVCCVEHHSRAVVTTVDYRSFDSYGSLTYSNPPEVSLRTIQNPNMTSQTLANKMYTLLLAECMSAADTTQSSTYLYWVVVNIHGTNVTSGEEVIQYLVPSAPSADSLFVMFLLEQTTYVNASAVSEFTGGPCQEPMIARCVFRVKDYLITNSLTIVGMRRLRYSPQLYRKYLLCNVFNVSTEAAECAGMLSYAVPCPSSRVESIHSLSLVVLFTTISTIVAFLGCR